MANTPIKPTAGYRAAVAAARAENPKTGASKDITPKEAGWIREEAAKAVVDARYNPALTVDQSAAEAERTRGWYNKRLGGLGDGDVAKLNATDAFTLAASWEQKASQTSAFFVNKQLRTDAAPSLSLVAKGQARAEQHEEGWSVAVPFNADSLLQAKPGDARSLNQRLSDTSEQIGEGINAQLPPRAKGAPLTVYPRTTPQLAKAASVEIAAYFRKQGWKAGTLQPQLARFLASVDPAGIKPDGTGGILLPVKAGTQGQASVAAMYLQEEVPQLLSFGGLKYDFTLGGKSLALGERVPVGD